MSREDTKARLEHLLLHDDDCKVIALTGAWGTGKTHLWKQDIRGNEKNELTRNALYCSLFGARSIDEIRSKLLLQLSQLAATEKAPTSVSKLWKRAEPLTAKLSESTKLLKNIKGIALAYAAPAIATRLIVLDDIERKHELLDTKEILGFVDELAHQHNCKILLIFNEHRLDEKAEWQELREKVIDENLQLSIDASEALYLAEQSFKKNIKNTDFITAYGICIPYERDHLIYLLRTCEIINIRVIRKIIKAVYLAFGTHENELHPEAAKTILPSLTLLTAAHFYGLNNNLRVNDILTRCQERELELLLNDGDGSDASKKALEAQQLLRQLGIYSVGEMEYAIAQALETGFLDIADLKENIANRIAHIEKATVNNELETFIERLIYEFRLERSDIEHYVATIDKKKIKLVSPTIADALYHKLVEIGNCEKTAENFLRAWLSAAEFRDDLDNQRFIPSAVQRLEPRIKKKLQKKQDEATNAPSIAEAVSKISSGGWSRREEHTLNIANGSDLVSAAMSLTNYRHLRNFLHEVCSWNADGTYGEILNRAYLTFRQGCVELDQNGSCPRFIFTVNHVLRQKQLDLIAPAVS